MCFKILCTLFIVFFFFGKAKSQVPLFHFDTNYPKKEISILSSKYLGFDIFSASLTELIETILQDPQLTIDTTISHSDTSRLYLRGYHRSFNPFGIPLDSVRLILTEDFIERRPGHKDTILILQTEGLVKGKENIENLRKAFRKMSRKVENHFDGSGIHRNKKKDKVQWESSDFHKPLFWLSVVTTGWGMNENRGNIIINFYLPLGASAE